MSNWASAIHNPFATPQAPIETPVISQDEIKPTDWHDLTPDLTSPFTLTQPTDGMTPEQVELLTEWEKTQAQLKSLKAYEMELRKCVVYQGGWFDASKTSGIERVELDGGFELESTKKENYNLKQDKKLIDAALTNFTDIEAEMLISWKASLAVAVYKKLPKVKQAHFDNVLEIKTGAPTLKINPPKVKE